MSDKRVEKFIRELREDCAFRADCDPPDYERADRWWAKYHREAVNWAPADRERVEIEIRRRTRT